jgi:hypothetical protein
VFLPSASGPSAPPFCVGPLRFKDSNLERLVRQQLGEYLVLGFECRRDAERVMKALGQRLERYGLRLAPDKTRLLDFRRPPLEQQAGKGPSTFDLQVVQRESPPPDPRAARGADAPHPRALQLLWRFMECERRF